MFIFTLTLSVDTPTGALIQVNPPPEIGYDSSREFGCGGLLNMNATLFCRNIRNQAFFVRVWPDESTMKNTAIISNGTSISFQLGPFINPLSLVQSGSFGLTSYTTSNSGLVYYYINRDDNSLTV